MFVTTDYIVNNVLRRKEYSDHWYMQFLGYALDCIQQLHQDNIVPPPVTVAAIDVDKYGVGKLPYGFLELVRITDSTRLQAHPVYGTSRPELLATATDIVDHDRLKYYYYNNWLYCWQDKLQGYVIRPNDCEIEITGWNGDVGTVLLEYTGICGCDSSKIHQYAEEAIIAFIIWQYKLNNRTYSEGEAHRAEADYMVQRRKLFRKMPRGKWSVEDIKTVFSRHDTMGVRWGNPLIYNQ